MAFDFQKKKKEQILILKQKIDQHKYISFDMFDTLVKRDCWRPVELFQLLQKKVDETFHINSNFSKLRVEAERKAIHSSRYEEITLNEIYEQLDLNLSKDKMQQVKQWEEEYEYRFCQWNPYIRPIYEYCIARSKTIFIITDIYLSYQLIERILKKLGIKYDALYVSSDKKLRKDTRSLFQYVLKEQKIKPESLLHIGDNKKSDIRMPKQLGIDVVHIAKQLSLNLFVNKKEYKNNHNYANLCAFINNHADLHSWNAVHPDKARDYFSQAGYEVEGPVLYGFARWLQEQFQKDHIEKVFFFARDGQIMQMAYQKLHITLPNTYMYTSRRALITPCLWMQTSLNDLQYVTHWPKFFTIKIFLENIGLNADRYITYFEKEGISSTYQWNWKSLLNNQQFKEVYKKYIEKKMIKNSKQQYNYLIRYLDQLNFKGNVAIVDIGWFGHMQSALQKIVINANLPTQIRGYYLGLCANSPLIDNIQAKGYLFDKGKNEYLFDLESTFNGIVETLFTADHGTTKEYCEEFGRIIPKLGEWEYEKIPFQQDFKWIKNAQMGALAFIDDVLKGKEFCSMNNNSVLVFQNWLQLGCHPSYQCAKFFGNLHILDDTIKTFVISNRENVFIINFRDSYWKVGYLTRLLGDKLPIFKLYKILKFVADIFHLHA